MTLVSQRKYYVTNYNRIIEICALKSANINGGDVQRKNVVNNVDKSSLWAP